ncbi:aminotransferase class IV [Streptomyces sp. ISL-14]|uniref:aminotransferase class IV n=1 Tax=Bacillus sp. ISL-4 TaxID=2819125 RepID=UPI001C1A5B14|nr:aminotransferase class IV [Bacillus sp. ISL-4]MBT2672501.1 aminotransferase class IV [Streptomyces sp. ISL-14]
MTEGTSSNVYIVKDSSKNTTPLSKHILSGITRIVVKNLAGYLRIPFVEKQFMPVKTLV